MSFRRMELAVRGGIWPGAGRVEQGKTASEMRLPPFGCLVLLNSSHSLRRSVNPATCPSISLYVMTMSHHDAYTAHRERTETMANHDASSF